MHTTSPRAATRPAPSTLHLIWRALTALLVSTVLVGTGSAAFAHDTLTDSSPAEGETLTEPPTQVLLTFSAEVLEMGAAAVVTDGDGSTWEAGEPTVDGIEVTVPLEEGLPNGSYEVSWRVTSSDGHPISGVIPFTVDAPAPETTEPAPAESAPTTATATADDTTDVTAEPTPSETTEPTAEETSAATTSPSDAAESESEEDSGGLPWVPILIGLGVAVVAYAVVRVVRR